MQTYGNASLFIGQQVQTGTSGSVLFIDASGNLGQDNNRFRFDGNNVIIGDISPGRLMVGFNDTLPLYTARFLVSRSTSNYLARIENTSSSAGNFGLEVSCLSTNSLCRVFSVYAGGADTNLIAHFFANKSIEFYDKVGIGQSSPSARLHIAAGTTAASSAPIKFISGSLMSTAEIGAHEFLTDDFYLTQTTNTLRHPIAWQDNPIPQQVFS